MPTIAFGSEEVVTSSAAATVMPRVANAVRLSLSVTSTVKLNVPVVVGVPEITPVLVESERPPGKLPELRFHVYGEVPPVAVSVAEYGTFTVPPDKLVVEIFSAGLMMMLNAAVAVCGELSVSVTRTVKLYVPTLVGAPEITPVPAVNDKPGGKLPELMLQVYGVTPPVAARVVEYVVPSVPLGKLVVVIFNVSVLTVMLRLAVAVCAGFSASLTSTVKLDVPVVVGVPEITPVLAASDSPAGKLPTAMLHVYGVIPPLAARVAE
jgi:hypothetical protein